MSVKLREMLEKRNVAVTAARAMVDKADSEKRSLNEDEQRQYDAHLDEATTLRENIDREQKLIDEEKRELGIKLDQQTDKPPAEEARSKAFRKLLTLDVGNGERLTAEEYRTLTAGNDTAAGFLITPQEFVKQLIAKVKDQVFLRAAATNFSTTNASGLGFPTLENDLDDTEWSTEIKLATEDTKLGFGKRELKPHPLKKLVKISDKLLRADGIDPEAIVMDRAGYKFGITEEKAFLSGTGNQQPLGLFTASALGINTDRDISTDMKQTDFTADALKAVKYSLKAQYMTKASWLFHRDAVAKIAKLKDGNGQYIFEMAEALGAIDTLMGRPLAMSEYAPNTFTTGKYVGMFGDFSWYYIATSLGLRVKRLNELFAATSEVGFIFDMEVDGMPVLSEAFARIKTA
ncbi:phage major capsid protein [Geomonas nitrogeniifigens]|uniref:phage major capsid protein n=1 Tax=Geomonas diazotrophica TaxID=2843197 RepID=UPI001C2BF182|nr:phage major capsid protein [Geomonas nitrogeniifigens]QXE85978.1 phage major capsid protein [Geomonas nitrogeniifigens]